MTAHEKLKANNGKLLEFSFIFALLLVTSIFFAADPGKYEEPTVKVDPGSDVEIIHVRYKAIEHKPRPERPKIPVAAEDEDEIDDVTIDEDLFTHREDIDLDLQEEVEDVESPVFTWVQNLPKRLNNPTLQYPLMAKNQGIEGRVVVQFVVNTDGTPTDIVFAKGNPVFKEASMKYVRDMRFTPAIQNDRKVRVRLMQAIRFRLQ